MKTIHFSFLILLISFHSFAQPPKDSLPEPKQILEVMHRAAAWQMNEFEQDRIAWPWWDWTNGALYTGILELGKVSGDKKYFEFLKKVGKKNDWQTGPRRFFGDDYCVAQMYSQLYSIYRKPEMIAKFRPLADSIVNKPHDESLEWKNRIQLREWAWADALFMAPPALAYLSTATGDPKYLQTADKLWWKTTDYLFDSTENLYYRDSKYFHQKEANGQKMFWARGNGWVMGGIVRMLENMPAGYPNRARFEELFRRMAKRIAGIQHPDGTWHTALLDQDSYPSKETSGTGFYAYALTWGIRHGLISHEEYFPVVSKAWQALVGSVHPNGMMGFVQKIGEKPGNVDYNSTEVYGAGAFLLAGSELYLLMKDGIAQGAASSSRPRK
jgi:rhamnogalacturonyl hydrolase YesR